MQDHVPPSSQGVPLPPLPIDRVLPGLVEVLAQTGQAVLCAAPGAGKTTRVPLALLEGLPAGKRIYVLVPRRLAARAAAAQMSRLLRENIGGTVGYSVRGDSTVTPATRLVCMTTGVFLRRVLSDSALSDVAAVLFDEFHERTVEADLSLALTLDIRDGLRPDLQVLVMSATLDAEGVSALLGNALVVAVEGRSFPVDLRHRAPRADERYEQTVVRIVREALAQEPGGLLVFLPGLAAIQRVQRALEETLAPHVDVVPLHGHLDLAAQDRAIAVAPPGRRKVVLATSLAETSLTIEGVRVVIDSGYARVPRFDPGSGLTHLETVRVTQAAAAQRTGRAGRVEPGLCWRLWHEEQTRALPAYNRPEILECDLATLVLHCASLGILDPASLRFLDPPPRPALAEARSLLMGLGALDEKGAMTAQGRLLSQLSLPPRVAHMVIEGVRRKAADLAVRLALLLTERFAGGTSVDIEHRLHELSSTRDSRIRQALRALETDVAKLSVFSPSPLRGEGITLGELLCFAFPERIALARANSPGEFVLANGKGAFLPLHEPLARAKAVVAAEVQGGTARGRITLAAALDPALIAALFPAAVTTTTQVQFDKQAQRVKARRVTSYGALPLDDAPVAVPPEAGAACVLEALKAEGLAALPCYDRVQAFLARLAFLRQHVDAALPALTEEELRHTVDDWLLPFVPGVLEFSALGAGVVLQALHDRIGADVARQLNAQAPEHYLTPAGHLVPIDYAAPAAPSISVRVQQLYGLQTHPHVQGVPLTLYLLSPASRPLQVTKDLPGFWAGSWADVRRDLRGRYPRHDWPENPARATPTARAKRPR